ncbi:MAG: L,D-transpeptidase family protein [Acidobacteriia bacterium]|nr:L,D-transpeptidase family protein [Terriglobia bacterium]
MPSRTDRNGASFRDLRFVCFALLLMFLPTVCVKNAMAEADGRFGAVASPVKLAFRPQQLTEIGTTQLHGIIDAAELADLRWPKFVKYRTEVRDFYDACDGALPWMRELRPTPQALAIIQLLRTADREGLNPEDYDGPRWDGRIRAVEQSNPVPESDLVRFDMALTVSAMRYISDLHLGRVNPRLFHFELDFDLTNLDLSEFLRQRLIGASDEDIAAAIGAVEPPFPTYHRILNALRTYLELARRDDGELLPVPRKAIRPGDSSYTGLLQLRKRLVLLGDLPEKEKDIVSPIYQGALVTAVKRFQQRHGLEPNGLIDVETLNDLNTPLSRRVAQLQLTLERLRWLPHQFHPSPIVVNIPEFRLRAIDEQYHWVLFMKVVVGRAYGHQTPVFASNIKSVIFRPNWNVPLSIVRAELLPHMERDAAYLTKNSYEIVDSSETVVSPVVLTEPIKRQLRSGTLGIRQTPGPNNALGLLKFDFPNRHDVYLHGTPARQLFSRSRRDFSHGCIRVEDPVALAAWLLRDKREWTAEHIRAATLAQKTFRVDLELPVPVLIVYGTAVVMEDGEVHFFRDIYGQDAALEQALVSHSYPE